MSNENHGGSGLPHTRKGRPKPPPKKSVRYTKIRNTTELELYLSGSKISCLICGGEYKRLGGHVSRSHSMSPKEYKILFNIPVTRSIACSDLREQARNRMLGMWNDNPKYEAVRALCKERVKSFHSMERTSKSTITSDQWINGVDNMNAGSTRKSIEVKRPIYMGLITEAIKSDKTLYYVAKGKTQCIYNYIRAHPEDLELAMELGKVKAPDILPHGEGNIDLICVDCGDSYSTRVKRRAKNCGCKRRLNAANKKGDTNEKS